MSLLQNDAIRCAYYEARADDMEYTCSGLFQLITQYEFPQDLDYMVRCEQSPDKHSRDRVDIVVSQVTDHGSGLVAPTRLMIEVKRKGSGTAEIDAVEKQTIKDATRCLQRFQMNGIYVTTVWGTCVRVWWAYMANPSAESAVLWPMFGRNAAKDKLSYVDVGSDHAWHLSQAFATIRGDRELPEKPAALEDPNAKGKCCEVLQ